MSDKQPRTFQIEHTQVGPFTKGSVVSDAHLARHNADIPHLLRNGAITETNLPASGEPLLGPDEIARQNQERIATAAMNNKGTDTFTGDDLKTMAKTPIVEGEAADDLEAMKVAELRDKAKAAGIVGADKMSKADLIVALNQQPAPAAK